ncbi:MAG: leucine-rich repeat domain-containing protein, partial [Clostridia bacterium]|nr:leucine-rich repeat domain-containing protein [Clostridia bacterium]
MEEQKDFQQPNAKKSHRAKALAIAILAVVAVGAIVAALVILLGGNNEQPPHTCAFGDWTTTKAATCVTEGEKTRVCECGEKETEAIAKIAHSYGDWVTTKEATCTSVGEKTRECDCGAKELSDVEMLAHHFSDWNIVKNVSCSEAGIKERSCACGEKETETIEKIPHTFASWITEKEPTCKEIGISSRMCSVCEYKETNAIAKTNNHTEVIDAAVPSTCVKTGLTEGKHCSVCNVVTVKQTEVPKVNHTYDDKYDEYCNVCDFKRDVECAHSESVVIPGREATCLESGLTEGKRCKNCEEIIVAQTEIDPKGHTEEKIVGSAPTCTATGLSDGVKCSVCDKTLVEQSVLPKSDHEYVDSIIAPTCIDQGYTLHKCSFCDFNYKDNYVNRIDHNWGEWKINGADTVRNCTNDCNCRKTQKILSLNATYNGIRLLTGESVMKEDVAIIATLSDNSIININDFALENVVMTVDGANYVIVKFMTVSTTVLVPAIYNNLPGTTATSEFTYTTQNDEVTITGFIGSSTEIIIPAHINRVPVRFVGEGVFSNKENIKTVTIPDSITVIGRVAFYNCKRMISVTFGKGLTTISRSAFANCISLTEINIPTNVITI